MVATEYEMLATKIDSGFEGVHKRIDGFKDEFNDHRVKCGTLFEEIHVSEALRKGKEAGIDTELKKRIDWAKVRTAITIAIGSLLSIAAIKIIFTNIGKFTW